MVEVGGARALIKMMSVAPPPFPAGIRITAYVFLYAALAVLLGGSWLSVAISALLGALVGTILRLTSEMLRVQVPILTVSLAFMCAVSVVLLARLGLDPGALPALIAPLIMLLTTGVTALLDGDSDGASMILTTVTSMVAIAPGTFDPHDPCSIRLSQCRAYDVTRHLNNPPVPC